MQTCCMGGKRADNFECVDGRESTCMEATNELGESQENQERRKLAGYQVNPSGVDYSCVSCQR